jgi:hypothetical protein
MPAARIFISHSAKEREAERIMEALEKALTSAGFDVFLDRKRLKRGEEWRDEIFAHLLECHGAVVLVSGSALQSNWVFAELSVLAPRRWLAPKEFVLIPVLVGAVSHKKLSESAFAPFDLARLTLFQNTSQGDIAKIVDLFRPLQDKLKDTPLDLLTEVVTDAMPPKQAPLERAARQMGLPVRRAGYEAIARAVARAFFHIPLRAFHDALTQHLAAGMSRSDAERVVDVVLPFSVRPESVMALASAALRQSSGPRPVAVLNAKDELMAELYVRRAAAQYPLLWTIVPVTASGGERAADAMAAEIRHFFRTKHRRYRHLKDAEIDKEIAGLKNPVVVIVPAKVRPQTINAVRQRFPTCTFLVRTGTSFPPPDRLRGMNATMLTPQLDPETEREALQLYDSLETMLGNMK